MGDAKASSQQPAASSQQPSRRLAGKRCLIVEDFAFIAVREAAILERAGASSAIAATLAEARAAAERDHFHVMLVDLRLRNSDGHDEDGREFIREIVARRDRTGIVALSAWLDRESEPELWRLGVVPIHKQEARDLVALAEFAMERAARLRRPGRSLPASDPIAKCSPVATFARLFGFTPRERETFGLLYAGVSPKEIACVFGRAESTVRDHIDAACEKCGVGNQCELVALYARGQADERIWREAIERMRAKRRAR